MKIFTNALLTTLFILLSIYAVAQSGEYDVRFDMHSVDCNASKIYVNIDVRANTAGGEFNLADQNYRFSHNRAAVVANSVAIDSQSVTGLIGGTSLYDPHTLNGSIDTVVSYNVVLAGGTGVLVSTDWLTIGRISFDILDIDECLELIWHDHSPTMFPPTFVGEKFAGNLFEVDEMMYLNNSNCPAPVCASLPIELSSFEATEEDCAISIDWTTASEKDNAYFLLEKSTDGETFEVIETINGQGTTSQSTSYNFIDNRASAMNFYRLTQVDFDGKQTISNTIIVKSSCFEAGSVFTMSEVYPNPVTSGPININFYTEIDVNDAEIIVTDVSGRLIHRQTENIALGSNNLTFESDQFAAGTYFVRVTSSDYRTTAKKFIKLTH